jgi:steroid 5-alpha reductase family enzyme
MSPSYGSLVMSEFTAFADGLVWILPIAALGWLVSFLKRNVAIVDSLWALFFVAACAAYASAAEEMTGRAVMVLFLVAIWALRLSGHITIRNWGHGEDHRYQAIRRNNEPGFAFKSAYIVFGLQAVLAWIISLPLFVAIGSDAPLTLLDYAGLCLWVLGFAFETAADWQLAAFRRVPGNAGRVLDRGLWRYSRHPNYFGECCLWWGFYIFAVAAGGWYAVVSPLLMTVLLLRVSGVALLERAMVVRRPEYRDYMARTNAFLPGPPRIVYATPTGVKP